MQSIALHVRAGNFLETSARLAGVSADQLRIWLALGIREEPRGEESPYVRFRELILKAQAEAEARHVAVLERAANPEVHALLLKDENGQQLYDKDGLPLYIKPQPPDPKVTMFYLERKFPKRWSKTEKHEHSGPNAGPQVILTLPPNGSELAPPVRDIGAIDATDEALASLPPASDDTDE